ncbi:hypothetical protein Ahia01_001273900 [Argonauta hians]
MLNFRLTCEEEGAELVTVDDRTVQFYVNDFAVKFLKAMWIGLHYIEIDDKGSYKWQWVNGKPVTLNFWNEGRFPLVEP